MKGVWPRAVALKSSSASPELLYDQGQLRGRVERVFGVKRGREEV